MNGLMSRPMHARNAFVQGLMAAPASAPMGLALTLNALQRAQAEERHAGVSAYGDELSAIQTILSDPTLTPEMRASYEQGLQDVQTRQGMLQGYAEPTAASDMPTYRLGSDLMRSTAEAFPTEPSYESDFWTSTIPRGAGSAASYLIGTALGGPGMGALLGASQAGASMYDEAKQAGLGEGDAQMVAAFAGATGITEVIPVMGQLSRAGPGIVGFGMKLVKNALEEGGQEGVQQVLGNLIARFGGVDPERSAGAGMGPAMAAGALLGVGGGAVGSAINVAAMNAPEVMRNDEGVFIWSNAENADLDALARAKEKIAAGADPRTVWSEELWAFDPNENDWFSEIPTNEMRTWQTQRAAGDVATMPENGVLRDVVDIPGLYEAYPEIGNVRALSNVQFANPNQYGAYEHSPGRVIGAEQRSIKATGMANEGGHFRAFPHEIQHAIDDASGKSFGTAPRNSLDMRFEVSEGFWDQARRMANNELDDAQAIDLVGQHRLYSRQAMRDDIDPGLVDHARKRVFEIERFVREKIPGGDRLEPLLAQASMAYSTPVDIWRGLSMREYQSEGGEQRARLAAERSRMTPEQLRQSYPPDMMEFPFEEQWSDRRGDPRRPHVSASIGGEHRADADLDALARAKEMADAGESRDAIMAQSVDEDFWRAEGEGWRQETPGPNDYRLPPHADPAAFTKQPDLPFAPEDMALPMDEASRMARARMMGDTGKDWYHGTFGDVRAFNDPNQVSQFSDFWAPVYMPDSYHGRAVYLSDNPEDVSREYGARETATDYAVNADYHLQNARDLLGYEQGSLRATELVDEALDYLDLRDQFPTADDFLTTYGSIQDNSAVEDAVERYIAHREMGFSNEGTIYPIRVLAQEGEIAKVAGGRGGSTEGSTIIPGGIDPEDGIYTGPASELYSKALMVLDEMDVSPDAAGNVASTIADVVYNSLESGEEGVNLGDIEYALRNSESLYEIYDDNGGTGSSEFLRRFYQSMGFKGVELLDPYETFFNPLVGHMFESGSRHLAVYDPSILRSRFAKFDPKNRESSNLLAGLAGLAALPAGAVAGLMAQDELERRGLMSGGS